MDIDLMNRNAESKCILDSSHTESPPNINTVAGEPPPSLLGGITAKTDLPHTPESIKKTGSSDLDYFQSVDSIRQEMLKISQNGSELFS